jgi:MoxR-like ATPase
VPNDIEVERASAFKGAVRDASRGLIDRDVLVELVALSAVAREHLLVVGPPGTAKSEAVRRIAAVLGGSYFEYLLGRFTEPSEIFGPVDLKRLREGVVETRTSDMLPEAHVAFLDEIFLGSTAILNTLLGVLNERTFFRGHTRIACPLRVCVAASNALPADESLAALADRFLVRVFVEPVADNQLEALLEGGAEPWSARAKTSIESLDALTARAATVSLDAVRPELAEAIRRLRSAHVHLSDRRVVKLQKLVAAAAAIDGRTVASVEDLWPIVFAVPTLEEQAIARETLSTMLGRAKSGVLTFAASSASESFAARAEKLATTIAEKLAAVPEDEQGKARHRLELEALARSVDASFPKEKLTESLQRERTALVAALGA